PTVRVPMVTPLFPPLAATTPDPPLRVVAGALPAQKFVNWVAAQELAVTAMFKPGPEVPRFSKKKLSFWTKEFWINNTDWALFCPKRFRSWPWRVTLADAMDAKAW